MRSLFFTLHRGVPKYRIRELTKASVATAYLLKLRSLMGQPLRDPPPRPIPNLGQGLAGDSGLPRTSISAASESLMHRSSMASCA